MDRPLAVTRDATLREELARLAAAAGVGLAVVGDGAEALRAWAAAPLVLVGADLVEEVARLAPTRRDGVHVVGWSALPEALFGSVLVLGAEGVVELPAASGWVTEALTDLGETRRREGLLLGVVGGSGGAGATTFACALGQVAARTGSCLVVDLDPLGPGCDRVLGLDEAPGVRWDTLGRTSGRLSGRSLREAVPHRDGVGVLTWPGGPATSPDLVAVREVLSAARRGHDTVVVDLPRSPDGLVAETAARCAWVVVVLRPTVTGLTAATRWVSREPDRDRLGLVVRGAGVDPRRLAESLDLGLGPVRSRRGPLARAAREVLSCLGGASVVA